MEMKPLIGLTYEFVFQIINTVFCFLILKNLLFKPVMDIISARESEIQSNLAQGERAKREGNKLKAEYEEKLSTAKEQGREIINQATLKAKEKEEKIIEDAKNEAKSILDRAEKDINRQREKAMNDIKSDISDLVLLTASKVIEKDIDKSKHQELINNFINEVAIDGSK